MPYRPGTPCRYPRCPNIVQPSQDGFCDVHASRRYGDPALAAEKRRKYGAAHRARREAVFREVYHCQSCGAQGDTGDVLDHIDGDANNNQRSNLQRLCRRCHNAKTNRYDGGFGNPRRTE